MKLRADEIAVATSVVADLLDRKGYALVSPEAETTEGVTRQVAFVLDVGTPALFARFRIATEPERKPSGEIGVGAFDVVALAAVFAKRSKGKTKGKKPTLVTVGQTDHGLVVTAADGEAHDLLDAGRRHWPKAFPTGAAAETVTVDLFTVLDTPIPEGVKLARGERYTLAPALRAIGVVRPTDVKVEHFRGTALAYSGSWFGISFRIVLAREAK